MRVLPYFLGAAVIVAIGGALAGGAIDTTPRQIHDSPPVPAGSGIAFDDDKSPRALAADHYALESDGETYEVAELRERGLYSQDRYGQRTRFVDEVSDNFDFAAAEADQRRWEVSQRRNATRSQSRERTRRGSAKQPRDLKRPAEVSKPPIDYVSRPVVQDTGGMGR